jgi:hypothetical protein
LRELCLERAYRCTDGVAQHLPARCGFLRFALRALQLPLAHPAIGLSLGLARLARDAFRPQRAHVTRRPG